MAAQGGKGPEEVGMLHYAALGLAWLVPGAGHVALGLRARGLVLGLTIHALFAVGVLIGGIKAVNPSDQPIWRYTQLVAGWPTLVGNVVGARQELAEHREQALFPPAARARATREEREKYFADHPDARFFYSPKVQEVGTVYCGIAGMLNLLVLFDLLVRVMGGADPRLEEAPREQALAGRQA